ncbi:uncharacterized protein LOC100568594 [Acyrthosiphon pisum]|uniref:Uncharacterized protein n=1 Tax=Acyrthosiphon pisum TaxID=7029 RepID=A0A8R2NRU9_ACYPI|nr:uncharacterized protein LOC100568594 [Acyrthosiphon pisum]|eukprot:XP_016661817.1 PREDICTED: uncharacterized protein LOC100568594 [Acyrthosiphon pisum]
MNTEQVSKEIKVRLNKVCNLLKEIEDILCKVNNDVQSSECNYSCNCVCGKQSIPEIIETLSNHCKDDDSRKCEKMPQLHVTCSEKRAKCKDLGREKMSSDVNDISQCCRRNNKQNHEKNNTNDLCCNISNKQFDNNTQYNECTHKKFRNRIKDINQKVMLYFDEKNKNKPNTPIESTIKSKKTSRFCSSS